MKLKWASIAKAIVDNTTDVYKIVKEFDNWSFEKQKSFVNEAFYNQVKYCRLNVDYYQKLFLENGIHENNCTDISSIIKIPILNKEDIRNNYDNLKSKELNKISYVNRRSGGTTGEPIQSLISKKAAAFETFTYFRGLEWMGWDSSMMLVKLFGGSLTLPGSLNLRQKIYKYASNSINIPAFEISEYTIDNIYSLLCHNKSVCLIGYASAINSLVLTLKSKNLILKNVKLVITTSEALIKDWEININNYFNCEIRSYYGCGEIGSLGYQLKGGDEKYKIPTEHVCVESIGNDSNLIITQLFNIAQPLLRYRLGDNGNVEVEKNVKYISKLLGRDADYFIRSNGEKVSPIFGTYSIQKSRIPVKKYQYIQHENNDIEFRYQTESGELKSEHKDTIKQIIEYVMREKCIVNFNESDKFILGKSKKHRICVRIN